MLWVLKRDGSFEHKKQMFKLMDKKIMILHPNYSLSGGLIITQISVKVVLSCNVEGPGPEVVKLFSYSTQLSMKFQLLIKN